LKEYPVKEPVAIFDIGSNAVRLVVYDGLTRAPVKIHNERNICGLGADLAVTGRLNPDGVAKALGSLKRFSGLVRAMKIQHVYAVATAAVRDAEDGADFIAAVRQQTGLDISVIDGKEEARLAALGVMANGMGQDGIIGDYGGGSLELVAVEKGRVKHTVSLPLGSHRLHVLPTRAARIKEIDAQLDTVDFLEDYKGRAFTALGGAWRSMAKAHMHLKKYPLFLLDHYAIGGAKAAEFADLMSRQSAASLEKAVGLTKKRVRDVGVAALTMERLFERLRPRELVFSAAGLREGLLFDQLPPALQKQDPLIAGCETFALRAGRFENLRGFHALARFVEPLFAREDASVLRLVAAGCILSDTCGFEHEDYQAAQAFRRIFVFPFTGLDHPGRAFLALSQYARYKGYVRRGRREKGEDVTFPAQKLLDERMTGLAVTAGLAQRLGYVLTGGALELLKHAALNVTPERLTLKLDPEGKTLNADVIVRAVADLAKAAGREGVIDLQKFPPQPAKPAPRR